MVYKMVWKLTVHRCDGRLLWYRDVVIFAGGRGVGVEGTWAGTVGT